MLLGAGTAHGKEINEIYGKAGDWEIVTKDSQTCVMKRTYGSIDPAKEQGLVVLYDVPRQRVALGFASNKPNFLPAHGHLNFDLAFLKKSSLDESWGSLSFDYDKQPDTYFLTHIFSGSADAARILRDLASNEGITIFLGPMVMISLPLDAADAVKKLRECAQTGAGSGAQ
jgi:hypothetical protein